MAGLRRILISAVFLATACMDVAPRPPSAGAGDDPDHPALVPAVPVGDDVGLPDDGTARAFDCRHPETGCPCDPEHDQPAECHSDSPIEDEHGRFRCLVGERACQDGGTWGTCAFTTGFDVSLPGQRAFPDSPAPCGFCDPTCYQISDDYAADPGDLSTHGSGIAWDGAAGGIVMSGSGSSVRGDFAWIGLDDSSEVAKIDLSDGAQVGRFIVGEAGVVAYPSRTTVDSAGTAYVAGIAYEDAADHDGFDGSGFWGSLTKIAHDPLLCRNAPTPTTSTDDVSLPLGTDDCVLWSVRVGTAQGAHPRGVAIDRGDVAAPDGRPWVGTTHNVEGGNQAGRAYQFDPVDGSVIQDIALPIHVFAAVADGEVDQRIWFSSYWTGALASVRVSDGSVTGPFYPPIPDCTGTPTRSAYSMAMDSAGRIWRGDWGCGGYVTGYNPNPGTWCMVDLRRRTDGIAVRLNPDGTNTVWATRGGNHRLYSFDPDDVCSDEDEDARYCNNWPDEAPLSRFARDYGCQGNVREDRSIPFFQGSTDEVHLHPHPRGFRGLDLDSANRLIVVDWAGPPWEIVVYDPDTGITDTYPTTGSFARPEALSDFTGYQRSAFTLRGTSTFTREYGVLDPACPVGSAPVWGDLTWSATTTDARINFYAVVASDVPGLDAATPVYLGSTETDASPIFVDDLLPVSLRGAPYIRITAALQSLDGLTSPVLEQLGLDWNCFDSE